MVSGLYEKKRDEAHTLCFAPLPSLAVRDDIRPAEVCRLYWPYCRIFVSLSDISKDRYARLPVALAKANGYLCGLTFQKMPYLLIFSTGAMAPAFFCGRQTVSPSLSWCAFSFPYPRSSTLRMLPLWYADPLASDLIVTLLLSGHPKAMAYMWRPFCVKRISSAVALAYSPSLNPCALIFIDDEAIGVGDIVSEKYSCHALASAIFDAIARVDDQCAIVLQSLQPLIRFALATHI